jgi:hypothetical protein
MKIKLISIQKILNKQNKKALPITGKSLRTLALKNLGQSLLSFLTNVSGFMHSWSSSSICVSPRKKSPECEKFLFIL